MSDYVRGAIKAVFTVAFVILFGIGICAIVEHFTMDDPQITTKQFAEDNNTQYIEVTANRYEYLIDPHRGSAEDFAKRAAKYEDEHTVSLRQICELLNLDPKKTSISTSGKLVSTLSTGDMITIDDNQIYINQCLPIFLAKNGGMKWGWEGYGSQQDSIIYLGGERRSIEELASITMIVDSVKACDGNYDQVNISGKHFGFFAKLFINFAGIVLILAVLVLIFVILL